jgi:hypothetical protein
VAGRVSNWLADQILNSIFGGDTFPTFTNLYFAFLIDTGSDDTVAAGTFTEATIGSNGYARVAVPNDDTHFLDAVSGSVVVNSVSVLARIKKLASDVQFPTATGAGWGLVRRWAVFDAATAGHLLFFGAVGTPQTVYAGNEPYISATDGFLISLR